jgi:hypothetical protein
MYNSNRRVFSIPSGLIGSDIESRMVKTIKIDDNTHAELSKLGSIGQTFNDVIWMLIKEHKEREKSKK